MTSTYRCIILPILLSLGTALGLGAMDSSAWRQLEEGKAFHDSRQYDMALSSFRTAARIRRDGFSAALDKLDIVTASPQALASKDDLNKLLWILIDRDLRKKELDEVDRTTRGSLVAICHELSKYRISDLLQNLVEALRAALSLGPQSKFGNSMAGLRRVLEAGMDFPDAEFWIGRVYMSEGEFALAEAQFLRALAMATAHGETGYVHEYRYQLADLYLLWREYDRVERTKHLTKMEGVLEEIIAGDPLWSDPEQAALLQAMEKRLREDGIDRFLTLYRHQAVFAVRAYSLLAELALKRGRYARALPWLMLAADAVATRVMTELSDRDPSWKFTDLSSLLAAIRQDEVAHKYATAEKLDAILYYLGLSLFKEGRDRQGRELMAVLAKGEGDWASLAGGFSWQEIRSTPDLDPELSF